MSRTPLALAFVAAATALYVPRLWLADSNLYTTVLTPMRLTTIGAMAKLGCLVAASLLSASVARRLEAGNPARRAWTLLAFGLAGFSLGQAALMTYELVLARDAPLPSVGDAAFLAGYAVMIAALASFIRAYASSGLPVGSPRGHALWAAAATIVLALLAALLLQPIAAADAPLAERSINVAYPLLDFAAIVPLVVLVRIAWTMRGGAIGRVWVALLAGFGCMAAGDVLFAYFSSIGAKRLEPLVDLTLLLGYFFTALGASRQRRLVA